MFSNRPLFASRADERYFVWTDSAKRARRALQSGRQLLVVGDRGAGKTSLLRRLAYEAEQADGYPALYVSIQETENLLQALTQIRRELAIHGYWDEGARAGTEGHSEDLFFATQMLRELAEMESPVRVLLDDVRAETGHALFGRLRDELWQLNVVWAVAIDRSEASGLLTPPADAFFETRVDLVGMNADERRRLLAARNDSGELLEEAIDRISENGPGNPRQLITLARTISEQPDAASPEDLTRGVEFRRQQAEALAGRPGAMLVTEMEGLGAVSATDERLLQRLGWSRNRAGEVLAELERGQIVDSFNEARRGRQGRPRKLYELKPGSAFAHASDLLPHG